MIIRMTRWMRVVGNFPILPLAIWIGAFPVTALGQGGESGNRDYYHARDTSEGEHDLRTVETYHLGPGMNHMKSKDEYSQALADFEFILRVFPNHPQALALTSELCDIKWRNPRCDVTQWFERAIQRNPGASQTYMLYGMHFHRLNKLPQAVENYKQAIALSPASANAHYNLGLAYFDAKEFDLANREAQVSYALGIPLPGLRDKLTRAGKWKVIDEAELKSMMESGDKDTAAVK